MKRHYRSHTGGNCRAKWNELHCVEPRATHSYDRQRQMRIHSRIPVSRKVLSCRNHAVILQAVYERDAKTRIELRIFAERSGVDDWVVRIVVDVEHGRVRDM